VSSALFVALRFASHDILIEKAQRKVERKKWQPPRLNFPWQKQKYNENEQQIALKLAHGH
jgi:hypothetical protein